MHSYLRAIGFSKISNKKEFHNLVKKIISDANSKNYVESDRSSIIVEYVKLFSPSTGIIVRGEYEEETNDLSLDFYYPFCLGTQVGTNEDITVERYAANESFAGVCEDPRVGVTVIFDVINCVDIMKNMNDHNEIDKDVSVYFSGMSTNGTIMLPIKKDEKELAKIEKNVSNRNKLITAARKGDENALESLTLDDIDTYALISKKIRKEDVYSIVDSYFMPYGVECDQYSILGEITSFKEEINAETGDLIYILDIDYNGIPITISINKEDLLGEPMPGRRFKGTVLLQGKIEIS